MAPSNKLKSNKYVRQYSKMQQVYKVSKNVKPFENYPTLSPPLSAKIWEFLHRKFFCYKVRQNAKKSDKFLSAPIFSPSV
jgi:hypothetical protein